MKIIAYLRRRYAWMNVSMVTLVALLQRSPTVRLVEIADEYVAESPIGALVKFTGAALASLGTINSMAGATILASSLTPHPTGSAAGVRRHCRHQDHQPRLHDHQHDEHRLVDDHG